MPNRPPKHRPLKPAKPSDSARNEQLHRKLIRSGRWQKFRPTFLAEFPLCNRCGEPATEVHHVRKLAAHPEDLCDPEHCEALCKRCHDRATGRGE